MHAPVQKLIYQGPDIIPYFPLLQWPKLHVAISTMRLKDIKYKL